ncbi:hypothetical protein BC827DRAFT_1169428 [Russula dissimulans]|nr:hypothetical protein BC827DRAFT_1169428 [Russula dissimulans]
MPVPIQVAQHLALVVSIVLLRLCPTTWLLSVLSRLLPSVFYISHTSLPFQFLFQSCLSYSPSLRAASYSCSHTHLLL